MQTQKQNLGKVSITCNGQWTDKPYDRLCLVHDGFYASYISKKVVPSGIPLSNEEYWQPVASLSKEFKEDFNNFKIEYIKNLAKIQIRFSKSRIAVQTELEKDNLTINEVSAGCEVYVIENKKSYILESIDSDNNKIWKLQLNSKIDSKEKSYIEGKYLYLTADKAIMDANENIIHETYLNKKDVNNHINNVIIDFLLCYKLDIPENSITLKDLSQGLIDYIKSGGNIVNNPDEEDITTINNTLTFKDRKYIENSVNGMGYKVLRKNMVGSINMLEQFDINEPNTIYEIRYDFCLDEQTINIPDNSILLFKGGKLHHGTVKFNNTEIQGITGSLNNYIECDIIGTFKKGQILYDDELNKLVLFNGENWVNLDGTTI